VKASLFFFGAGSAASEYRLLRDATALADAHTAFDAVWVPERHFGRLGGAFPNPAVLAAALAATTTRLRLRAGSLVLPLHDPIRAAEEWAVVDVLSNGRAEVALASGWLSDDFVLAPANFGRRKELLIEQAETISKLWRGERIARVNGAGEEIDVGIAVQPLQATLPMWLTSASGAETAVTAARRGAGLLTHLLSQDMDQLAAVIGRYADAWEAEVGEPRAAVMTHLYVARNQTELTHARRLLGAYLRESIALAVPGGGTSDGAERDDIEALVEAGVERLLDGRSLVCTASELDRRIAAFRDAGVADLALLVDFGPDWPAVGRSLEAVAEALTTTRRPSPARPADVATPPRARLPKVLEMLRLLAEHPVAHLQATPTLLRLIANDPQASRLLGGLEEIVVGGEMLPGSLAQSLRETGAVVHNVYGPTEATVWATSMDLDSWDRERDADPPLGGPLPGYSVYVLDDDLDVMPPDVPGEIYIGGSALSTGYWNDPRRTAERFLPDPFGAPGERMYRTGDVGACDDAGVLRYLGREDAQVKVRGHRIELAEVERAMAAVAGVRAAAAAVVDGALVACVETAPAPNAAHSASFDGETVVIDDRYRVHGQEHELRALYDELFTHNEYGRAIAALPSEPVVLDVGANIGMFAVLVHAYDPSARLVCVEPVPDTASRLRRTLGENGIAADVLECGVWETAGELSITAFPEAPGFSSAIHSAEQNVARALDVARAVVDPDAWSTLEDQVREVALQRFDGHEIRCEACSLDELVLTCGHAQIDLLKLDIEGAELRVIESAGDETLRRIDQIVVEAEEQADAENIASHLSAHGFEVETRRATMPSLRVAGVWIVDAFRAGRRPPREGFAPDVSGEVRHELRRTLPDYMIPDRIVELPAIPQTANGKIDRRAVAALLTDAGSASGAERPGASQAEAPPGRTLEETVGRAWTQVLGSPVGEDRNFFDAGGNSLLMLKVQARLRAMVAPPPSLVSMFEYPTIATLAAALRRDGATVSPSAEADR
jgi:natural product biosynthesis luciferase-like monooxygenase protein/FkbM family methyltransferase